MSHSATETQTFKTEIKELLHLIIHTLYTHKDIFLRELLSNASDALSKVQFESLTNADLYDKDQVLEITLTVDEKEKTITIEDTGIGMNRDELIQQIGTIAHSGTKRFFSEAQKQNKKVDDLIGQFGVGFYSVFMVAHQVTIETRSYRKEDSAVFWESDGQGTYEIADSDRRKRGTKITLHLKEEELSFASEDQIKQLVNKYSNFLPFPVRLKEETINQPTALWRQSKSGLKEEDYKNFYKEMGHDFMDPLHYEHIQSEAPVQFNALMYFPQHSLYDIPTAKDEHGLKLYAKRIFIQDHCKELVPRFLRFLKGLVDSEDLPLNVSRETVQSDQNIKKINKVLTKKALESLKKIADSDIALYQKMWKAYGKFLKEGVYEEHQLRDKLTPLLRFYSTQQIEEPTVSLDLYLERKTEEQQAIYYLLGENLQQLKSSPHLDLFTKHGMEVLLLDEPMDDLVLSALSSYQDLPFINVESGDLKLPENIKEEVEIQEPQADLKTLADRLREILQDQVNSIRFSKALSSSPCRFFSVEGGLSHSVRKKLSELQGFGAIPFKRDLELNPDHPFVASMAANVRGESFEKQAKLLYHLASLYEGSVEDPQELAGLILPYLT